MVGGPGHLALGRQESALLCKGEYVAEPDAEAILKFEPFWIPILKPRVQHVTARDAKRHQRVLALFPGGVRSAMYLMQIEIKEELTRRIEEMYCSWIVPLETPSVDDIDPCVLDLPGTYHMYVFIVCTYPAAYLSTSKPLTSSMQTPFW